MLCCVGPTLLALIGIISAATAFAWANDLYDNYAWWFRLGGLAVLVLLVWIVLRRRNQCSLNVIRRLRWRLVAVLVIAIGTYAVLYAVTTWLGTLRIAADQANGVAGDLCEMASGSPAHAIRPAWRRSRLHAAAAASTPATVNKATW
ncbi:hypothetical protein MSIMFB_00758 [Mycobacterium simulans]|uniref:Uncharacterized protein n=1 Tax=Mycobacterium simulans TaxID=627089 RepID=A0A7Z7N834_9MYCO|nr:hypothetical protein MSIMFB_00758 [Mycobacterium simulans]